MKKALVLIFVALIVLSLSAIPTGCTAPTPAPPAPPATAPPAPPAPAPPTGEVYHWKWFSPYNLAISPSMDQFPKIVAEKTKGQVEVELYVAGEHPYGGGDLPEAIRSGACQMADILPGYCIGIAPALGAVDLPFFCSSEEEEDAMKEAVVGEVLNKLYNDYNMMPLLSYSFPGQAVIADVLFKDFDSLKGKKIRVYNKVTADMITALGGSPATIPPAEVYTALQRGTVDGAIGSTAGQVATKNVEAKKCLTRWHAYGQGNTYAVVVSKDAWAELPASLQALVREAAEEYQAYARKLQHDVDAIAVCTAVDVYGVTACAVGPSFRAQIREKMKPVYEAWAATFSGGEELLAELEAFHTEWMKTH